MSRSKPRAAQLSLFVFFLALGLCHFPVAAEETPGLTLAAARQQALAHSWDLLAAKSDLDQATAQSLLAREIQNPSLSSTVSQIPLDGSPTGTAAGNGLFERSYQTELVVSQLLEGHGKRRLRRASAAAGIDAASARFADARRVLDAAVAKDYAAAALAEANGRLLALAAQSLAQSARIAGARFAAGDISASDRQQIEVEAARFALEARTSEATARNARIALDVLLGMPAPAGNWHAADSLEELAQAAGSLRIGAPSAEAPARPDLVAAEAALHRSELDLALEAARRVPDPTLLLLYDHIPPDRTSALGVGISIDLPVWNRHQGAVATASVARDQAARERERVRALIAGERATARTAFANAAERFNDYQREILPKALEVRETVVYAYQNGGASLLELLEAERNANDLRLAAAQAAADLVSAAADLSSALDLPFPLPIEPVEPVEKKKP
jgi:cobalt-zinc-cadmium efflux system outer membrane protein